MPASWERYQALPAWADYDAARNEWQALIPQFTAEREAKQAKADAEKTARDEAAQAAKGAWIAEHGSARLKLAWAGEYSCTGLYLEERATLEYPGYAVNDALETKERINPSLEALQTVQALGTLPKGMWAEVVWVTSEGDEREQYDGYERREAVVIHGFQGKHVLVRFDFPAAPLSS